jgi:hypothetical protein
LTVGCVAVSDERAALPDGSDAVLNENLLGDWALRDTSYRTARVLSLRRQESMSNDYVLSDQSLGVFPYRQESERVRLIRLGGALFLDIPQFPPATPSRTLGYQRFSYAPVRIRVSDDRLFADRLNDEFVKANAEALPSVVASPSAGSTEMIVITATRGQLRRFLAANAQNADAWTPFLVLERVGAMPNGPDVFARSK